VKIAFVVHDYHRTGGHSRYVVELAERFSTAHEVHIFANTFHKDSSSRIQFHRVPAFRYSALTTVLSFLLPATMSLSRDFDIIHAQGLCSLRCDVVTAHICNRAWFMAQKENGSGVNWKLKLFATLVGGMEKPFYRVVGGSWVIAVSQKVRRELGEFYGRKNRLSVIHHGVDVEQFTPKNRDLYRSHIRQSLGVAESEVVFLFVGDLRKGAIPAMKALRLAPDGKLLFVSPTSLSAYQHVAEQLGLARRVIFCPPTNRIERYYAAADAFVFPTPYDAFGMVLSEAMAAGLPVITSRQAGASELIEHGHDGLLVENPLDIQEIAQHVQRLTRDPEERYVLGLAARKKMQRYSWEGVAEQTMRIYEQVCAERRG